MELQKLAPTKVYRNAYGDWTAEDVYSMPEGRVLNVLTMKRFGGQLSTTATVKKPEHGGYSYEPFSDYSERMGSVKMRCTEAGVLKQHCEYSASPDRVRAVMERAVAHYNKTVQA